MVKCGDIRGLNYFLSFLTTKNAKLALLLNMVAYQGKGRSTCWQRFSSFPHQSELFMTQ
jgi:hypothetical protein